MEHPSKDIWVAQCHPDATDPAFDLDRTDARGLLAAYRASRTYADLAAVPCVAGASPVLVRLRPLTPEQRAALLASSTDSTQYLTACLFAAVAVMEGATVAMDGPHGREEALASTTVNAAGQTLRWSQITPEGLRRLADLGGGALLDELGELALQRATVHPRALAPFRQRSLSGVPP